MKLSKSEAEGLLPALFSGDLSQNEINLIDEWRKESPENESIYIESCKAWDAIPLLNEMEKFNSFEALKKVNKRLVNSERSGLWTIIQRAAAILLLPVLVFTAYQTSRNLSLKKHQEENIVMQKVSSRQGMIAEFDLPDGTKVWLNSNSELQFPVTFSSDIREVKLKGEAFFEVAKNENQPFIVNSKELNVEVLGTSFNFISYDDEKQSEVILFEGEVMLSVDSENAPRKLGTIQPGQRAVYLKEAQTLSTEVVVLDKYVAWRDGNLIFLDDTMDDVVKRLSRWFNVEIIIDDPELNDYIYKATFRNENLMQVLKLLTISAPIDYRIIERKILADGEFTKQKIFLSKKKK